MHGPLFKCLLEKIYSEYNEQNNIQMEYLSSLRGISEEICLGGLNLYQRNNIQIQEGDTIKIGFYSSYHMRLKKKIDRIAGYS
jgi:hypothetical protein